MAYRVVGAKPLSGPMLEYCYVGQLGRNLTGILIKIYMFSFRKMHLITSAG